MTPLLLKKVSRNIFLRYTKATLLFFTTITISFAQPSNNCNNYSGTGIPVGTECIARDFNIEPTFSGYWDSANGCTASDKPDSFWWFEATSTESIITYYPTGGTNTAGLYDPILTVFTANQVCSPTMNRYSCVNNYGNGVPETMTITTVVGSKYLVRIQNTNNNAMYGRICIVNKTIAADNPCGSVPLNVNALSRPTWFTTVGATNTPNSLAPNPACSFASGHEDVWIKFVMPSTDVALLTERNGNQSMTSSSLAIYKSTLGGCNLTDLTYVGCTSTGGIGNMAKMNITNGIGVNEIPTGTTVYARIWASSTNNSGNGLFGISVYPITKCGNPAGLLNDFCESPATMYKMPNTDFSASTAGIFTGDQFDRTSDSKINHDGESPCVNQNPIYIHNNSWYQFTASSTNEFFPFSTTCDGIQALVFEVTYDAKGCCTGFRRVSNCNGKMPQGNNVATITANNLQIGSNYVLMVDGYAGAQCDFTIHNWNAINILLGVEMQNFYAVEEEAFNHIVWKTSTEENNDYFDLLRSYDGIQFEKIGTIDGAGKSSSERTYEWDDQQVRSGICYYRLIQTDFDGKPTIIGTIAVDRQVKDEGITNLYPNPADQLVTIELTSKNGNGNLQIVSSNGQQVYQSIIEHKGIHSIQFDTRNINQGVYIVKYTDETSSSFRQLIVR